jgi:hypothetical protein
MGSRALQLHVGWSNAGNCHETTFLPEIIAPKNSTDFSMVYPYKPGSVETQINHRRLLEIWHPIGCELCQTKPNEGQNKQTKFCPGRPTLYLGGWIFSDNIFSFEIHFKLNQSVSLKVIMWINIK